jgi:site-specific DNA-cytosine methylase
MKHNPDRHYNQFKLIDWDEHSKTVIGATRPGSGAMSVADPRPNLPSDGNWKDSGHYGVVPWRASSGAITASTKHDSGAGNVADPRIILPAAAQNLVCVIRSLDGTWHRPFTTLELAALQSLVDPEEYLVLEGMSDSVWREHIGNMVPPDAGEAMSNVFGETLLLAWSGETFTLGSTPIWVRNVAIALSVAQPEVAQ